MSHTVALVFQDLIIFPDDCEFKRVNQCTTGRVYVLKFKAGSKKMFFWMQVRGRCSSSFSREEEIGSNVTYGRAVSLTVNSHMV